MSYVTVTELARHFAEYVNRVAYRRESFTLVRGKRPLAELRPLPVGVRVSELPTLIASLPRILAELSAGMTLEPGDVVSTGTPSGVGHARTPPEFMQPGDVLETEVVGVGMLRNRIV